MPEPAPEFRAATPLTATAGPGALVVFGIVGAVLAALVLFPAPRRRRA